MKRIIGFYFLMFFAEKIHSDRDGYNVCNLHKIFSCLFRVSYKLKIKN